LLFISLDEPLPRLTLPGCGRGTEREFEEEPMLGWLPRLLIPDDRGRSFGIWLEATDPLCGGRGT
jgi:hypothetical protein